MSKQGMTETGSVYSEGFTKIEPEPKHETLIDNCLFRLKDDKSYQILGNSIELMAASAESLSPRKYKPQKFEFRAYNTVTKGYLRFSKIHQMYKDEAEKLLFQIGRSKYRYLQQVVDVLTDFDIPEEASPSKGSLSKSGGITFSWNESSLHSPPKPQGGASSLSIYNMGMPYSWMDENSEFIWVVSEDVLGTPEDPTTFHMLMVDKEMEAGDFANQGAGFQQAEFLQYARQLVGGVAQVQLLGKPHGNICPMAFGQKSNGVVRLSNLFEAPCTLYPETRAWADAFWHDSKAKKWSFKDDALAVGRILLSMLLLGIQSPDDTLKNFTKLCNEGREKLARKIPYQKVREEQEKRRRSEQDKYLKVIASHKKFDPNLLSIVMKLIEPREQDRLDALGALSFLQNFYKYQDFQFSEMLMSEVLLANERLTTFESSDGKFEFSLNKSGRPPAQEGSDDQSLIEDQFEPEELIGSPVHAQFVKQKEAVCEEVQKLKSVVEEGVVKFQAEKEEKIGNLSVLENEGKMKELTYVAKGWQNTNGILKVTIPEGKLSVTGDGVYTGDWEKGERKGFGIFKCQEFIYAGFWDKDKPNGWGEKFFQLGEYQGDKFVGEFRDGVREGIGQYTSDEGDHIYATYKKDIQVGLMELKKKPVIKAPNSSPVWYRGYARHLSFEGFGVLVVNQGAEQEEMVGTFSKDKLDGYGTHTVKSGKYTGYFKQNEYNGFGMQENDIMTSIGTFKKFSEEGWCTVRYKNGDFYLGEMKQGVVDGFGLMTQSGVVQYNGQFSEGEKAGKGRMIRIGDFQYIGGFCSSKRHGFGVMISFDKWSYEGYFNQGKREGIGVLVMDEGQLHNNHNTTMEIQEDAKVESREALSKLVEKLGPLHSRQQEEEKKSPASQFKKIKKYDTESDEERYVRSFEGPGSAYNRPSIKHIQPTKLDPKLRRTSIVYKRPMANLSEVRRYILNSTDDQRPYLSSSQSQNANHTSSRPQSQDILCPTKYQTYTGAFREDRRNGLGRCQYIDGSVYHGQWVLDMREGEDCTYITKKFRYTGSFKADMISGYGKQVFMPEGEEYEGQFFEGARHGHGIYIYKDGQFTYEGEFKYGRRSGTGKLSSMNGSYYYDGDWKRDQPHGYGKERMLNGDFYQGNYTNGLRDGQGKYQFVSNGSVYVGSWYEGLFQGRGQKWNQKGYHFDGSWLKGRATGFGVQTFPNNDKYEGFFQNDQRSGYGIYYFGSMNEECLCYGMWERGQPDVGELRWIEGQPTPGFLKWRDNILKISNFDPSP